MSTPRPATDSGAIPELTRTLYPHSWVFSLIRGLPQWVPALFAAGVLGKTTSFSDRAWLVAAVFIGILVLNWWHLRFTRWDLTQKAVLLRQGMWDKETKVIPFNRIQNVKLIQNPLHRVFGVARVELESAGSRKPEAVLNVLRYADALNLSELVQSQGRVTVAAPAIDGEPAQAAPASGNLLLRMNLAELIRYGLVSNRGLIVLAAAVGGAAQFMDDVWEFVLRRLLSHLQLDLSGQFDRFSHLSLPAMLMVAMSVVMLVVLFVKLLSIVLAFWTHYNFQLVEQPRRLQTERGLLSRWHDAIVKSRIQAFRIRESVWHRLFKRQTVDVDTLAGSESGTSEDGMPKARSNHLLPVATPAQVASIIEHLAPAIQIEGRQWEHVAARNVWRLLAEWALIIVPVVAITQGVAHYVEPARAFINTPFYWACLVMLVIVAIAQSWYNVRHAAFSLDAQSFGIRKGWISKTWHIAEIRRAQAVSIRRNPLDRRFGTASLVMDTPGAQSSVLQMDYLPYERACALRDTLLGALNKSVSKSA